MSILQKFFFDWTPKGVGQVYLKFQASAGRLCVKLATQPACNCWETSNTLVQPLLGSNQKIFFGGCSQRLTLKDFTTMSWIHDNKGPGLACYWLHRRGAARDGDTSCQCKWTKSIVTEQSGDQAPGGSAVVIIVTPQSVLTRDKDR